MTALIIATGNPHKLAEIGSILGVRYRYLALRDFPEAPKTIEDQPTFAGNAVKKARELAKFLQGLGNFEFRVPGANALVVADDSGLEVDALKGAPGVHSARFAALDQGGLSAGNSMDAANNAKLLQLLQHVPQERRVARFRCAIAVVRVKPPQPALSGQTFEGVCEGRILTEPRGRGGFGYDPLFAPVGHAGSFAELKPDIKNQVGHRGQAMAKFRRYLETLKL